MQYPDEILPKSNYKKIPGPFIGYILIRRTSQNGIIDSSTGQIKTNVINDEISQEKTRLLSWSCCLFNKFNESHFKYSIKNKEFNKYWNEDDSIVKPIFEQDFEYLDQQSCYFLRVDGFRDIEVPYEKGQPPKKYEAKSNFEHYPTKANFWHFELRWKDKDNNSINPNGGSAYKENLLNNIEATLRSNIRNCFCEKPEPDSIKIMDVKEYTKC